MDELNRAIAVLRADRDNATLRTETILDGLAGELGVQELRRAKGSAVIIDEMIKVRRYAYSRGYLGD